VDGATAELVSGSVPDGQRAACWLVVTRDGHTAFVANAGSLDRRGVLTLQAGAAGVLPAGGKALDLALTGDERLLYDLDAGNHALVAFTRRHARPARPAGLRAPHLGGGDRRPLRGRVGRTPLEPRLRREDPPRLAARFTVRLPLE
jgi:hypothetical protein